MQYMIKYDAACKALAELKTVDEVKTLMDKTAAIQEYHRRAENRTMEIDAAEIRIRAERRLGELLRDDPTLSHGGSRFRGPTLKNYGIGRGTSARVQKIARIPESEFEGRVGSWRDDLATANIRVTTNFLKAGDRATAKKNLQVASLPEGVYAAIYADPPWSFQTRSDAGKDRSADNHYPTMSSDEINMLNVGKLAADDCVLFMWATMPMLPQALKTIEAWGFTYKTVAFTWVKMLQKDNKPAMGLGYWTRSNAELCLLATKGSPRRINADVPQVIMHQRLGHSRKPAEAATRIMRLVAGPYIELFARDKKSGWDAWGSNY